MKKKIFLMIIISICSTISIDAYSQWLEGVGTVHTGGKAIQGQTYLYTVTHGAAGLEDSAKWEVTNGSLLGAWPYGYGKQIKWDSNATSGRIDITGNFGPNGSYTIIYENIIVGSEGGDPGPGPGPGGNLPPDAGIELSVDVPLIETYRDMKFKVTNKSTTSIKQIIYRYHDDDFFQDPISGKKYYRERGTKTVEAVAFYSTSMPRVGIISVITFNVEPFVPTLTLYAWNGNNASQPISTQHDVIIKLKCDYEIISPFVNGTDLTDIALTPGAGPDEILYKGRFTSPGTKRISVGYWEGFIGTSGRSVINIDVNVVGNNFFTINEIENSGLELIPIGSNNTLRYYSYQITNVQSGRVVQNGKIDNKGGSVYTNTLNKGIYLLNIIDEGKSKQDYKFIIK